VTFAAVGIAFFFFFLPLAIVARLFVCIGA
jgi:hypothetical protein